MNVSFFAISVKRHFWDAKNLCFGHALPASVNNRVIKPLRKGFIFAKNVKFHEN